MWSQLPTGPQTDHRYTRPLSFAWGPICLRVLTRPGMALCACRRQVSRWRTSYVSVRFFVIWLATSAELLPPGYVGQGHCVRPPPPISAPHVWGDGPPSWGPRRSVGLPVRGLQAKTSRFVLTWLAQWQLLNCVRNVVVTR
jgi:hypothetical protein